MIDELKVYTKPDCPYCMAVTGHLQNEGVEYEEIDSLMNDDAFQEMKAVSGQGLAPTVRLGDEVLADCRVKDLKRLLQ
ncbi:MAG: glutaredoxin family protein [Verrucomicrobiota bacterium]